MFLTCLAFATLLCGVRILQALGLVVWAVRQKKQLLENRKIYYGKVRRPAVWRQSLRIAVPILILLVLLTEAVAEGMDQAAVICAAAFLVFGIMFAFIANTRPSRGENWVIQIVTEIAVPIALTVITLVTVILTDSFTELDDGKAGADGGDFVLAPLIQEDFKQTSGKLAYIDLGKQKNFLGEMSYYYVEYLAESDSALTDNIRYEIYESSYSKILNGIWERKLKDRDSLEDCSEAWETEQAVVNRQYLNQYYVRDKNKVFTLVTADYLNEEQIRVIKEKIGM